LEEVIPYLKKQMWIQPRMELLRLKCYV
jgi:hypothetical protein